MPVDDENADPITSVLSGAQVASVARSGAVSDISVAETGSGRNLMSKERGSLLSIHSKLRALVGAYTDCATARKCKGYKNTAKAVASLANVCEHDADKLSPELRRKFAGLKKRFNGKLRSLNNMYARCAWRKKCIKSTAFKNKMNSLELQAAHQLDVWQTSLKIETPEMRNLWQQRALGARKGATGMSLVQALLSKSSPGCLEC